MLAATVSGILLPRFHHPRECVTCIERILDTVCLGGSSDDRGGASPTDHYFRQRSGHFGALGDELPQLVAAIHINECFPFSLAVHLEERPVGRPRSVHRAGQYDLVTLARRRTRETRLIASQAPNRLQKPQALGPQSQPEFHS